MKKNCVLVFGLLLFNIMVTAQGWLTSIEEAKKKASLENKDIIVDFTGSDWCGWCVKLKREVFDTPKWKEEGPKRYVMVELDFPRGKELSEEQKKYNEKMAEQYRVQGFPTILLLDKDAKLYAQTGYQEGGPEKYLVHLEELGKRKIERDELLGKLGQGNEEEQLQQLDRLMEAFEKWEISHGYPELRTQRASIMEKIAHSDTENKKGLLLKYSIALAKYHFEENQREKVTEYIHAVKKYSVAEAENLEMEYQELPRIIDEYFKKNRLKEGAEMLNKLLEKKPTGEALQKIYYNLGFVEFNSGQKEKAIDYLEKAEKAAPDTKIAEAIRLEILPYLKK